MGWLLRLRVLARRKKTRAVVCTEIGVPSILGDALSYVFALEYSSSAQFSVPSARPTPKT